MREWLVRQASGAMSTCCRPPYADPVTDTPSLIEWAGGPGRFRALIDAFYDRVERDELLSRFFPGGVHEDHRAHVTDWWVEVFGGAADYTERHGGYPAMLRHHLDLGITAEQRSRFAALTGRSIVTTPAARNTLRS
jgi:hemoglobin